MAFNPFTPASDKCLEIAGRLGINIRYKPYVIQTSKGLAVKEVYEIDKDVFESLREELKGSSQGDIFPGDRVFITSGSMITGERWSIYLKKIGASQVSDITKANVIIQNNKYEDENSYQEQARLSAQLITGRGYVGKSEGAVFNALAHVPYIAELVEKYGLESVIFTKGFEDSVYYQEEQYLIYPFTLQLIDAIRKGVRFINEDVFVPKTVLGTVLDEESCQSIIKMFESNDAGNHEVARHILFQCNIEPSWYYIWRIANSSGGYGAHRYGRDKNGHLFIEKSEYEHLQRIRPNEFANFMRKKNLLTEEIFRKIKQEIAATAFEEALNINDYYDVKLVIKPQYKHLDPNMELLDAALQDAVNNKRDYEDESSEVEENADLDRV